MAHGRQEDPRGDRNSGGTYSRSANASQYRLSENEHVEGPPQSTAPLSSQYLGSAPWNAPLPHPSVQEPCYASPCANNRVPGLGVWHGTRYNFPPVPVLSTASQYTDQGVGNAGGAIPRYWDNENSTCATCALPLAPNSQADRMAGLGPTPAASVHSEAGTNAQPIVPAINAPMTSESLKSLARRLILDLGTHVNELNMKPSGRGGLKVTITLETADVV